MSEAIRGVRAGSEAGPTEAYKRRLKIALSRVLPIVDSAGVRYGYMVKGRRGRPAYGPFTDATQALESALQDMESQGDSSREAWARRKERNDG